MRRIALEEARTGDVLAEPVECGWRPTGRTMLPKGAKLSTAVLSRLEDWGIWELVIEGKGRIPTEEAWIGDVLAEPAGSFQKSHVIPKGSKLSAKEISLLKRQGVKNLTIEDRDDEIASDQGAVEEVPKTFASIRVFLKESSHTTSLSMPPVGQEAAFDIRNSEGQLIIHQGEVAEEQHIEAFNNALFASKWVCLLGREESAMVDRYRKAEQGTIEDLNKEDRSALPASTLKPGVKLPRGVCLLGQSFLYLAQETPPLSQSDIDFLLDLEPGKSYYIQIPAKSQESTAEIAADEINDIVVEETP